MGWQRRAGGPGRATQARPWVPASGWTQQLPAGSSLNAINTQHLHWERAPGAWEVGVRRLPASAGMEVTLEGDWDSAGRGPLSHEFLHDGYVRAHSQRGWAPGPQQEPHHHSREIQTSVHLLLPGEIGKHAVSEATNVTTILRSSFYHMDANAGEHHWVGSSL